MILKLVLKDIKMSWRTLLVWTILCLLWSAFFIVILQDSWRMYISLAPLQISFIIGVYAVKEKTSKGEVLTCSLPVLRSSIIISRYVTAAVIAVIGIFIWSLNAWILHTLFSSSPDDFQFLIGNLFVFIIAIFVITIFVSVFMPILNVFNAPWVFMNLMIGCFIVIYLAIILVHPSIDAYYRGTKVVDLSYLIIVTLIAATFLFVSIILSQKMFLSKDLS